MENRKLQTVIFDLDGTLIDTEPTAALAVRECFQEWNLQITQEDSTYVTGRTWDSAFNYLSKKYNLPLPKEDAKKCLIDRYRFQLEANLQIVAGGAEAVQYLAQFYTLALVSGSNRIDILWALQKLNIQKYFQVILGAEDYPRSKPQPDGFLKALNILSTSPKQCLVFEDSTAGIASARSAGTWVVAITSTNHFHQDHSLAHLQIADLTAVNSNWIKSLPFFFD